MDDSSERNNKKKNKHTNYKYLLTIIPSIAKISVVE